MRNVALFAFSTSSSAATIPVTLKTVSDDLGVKKDVASFVVPVGATINMDGTAIMQGLATMFIASTVGVDLSLVQYGQIVLLAMVTSIGTAAVPSAGTVTLALILGSVGLPLDAIGLILAVDRILDMIRTSVNVCGDAAVSCIVAKSESELEEKHLTSWDNDGDFNNWTNGPLGTICNRLYRANIRIYFIWINNEISGW